MKFIVTVSKFQLDNPPRNPFRPKIEDFGHGTITRANMDVEADDEQHVRRLWEQSQKDGFNLGFTIEKIELA